jgi:antitoxin PrlF
MSCAERPSRNALVESYITVVMKAMAIAHSKVTAQGQISVPAEVRKKLGIGPGSVLEWDELDNQVVVRRVGRYTSQDVHQGLFPEGTPKRSRADVETGIRAYVRRRHAGD